MTVYYSDPWNGNKFGYIYSGFVGETFSVHFDEARIYRKDEKTLTLAGKFVKLNAVLRKFKPEEATMPVLLTLDLHKEDYTVNRKDEKGNWKKSELSVGSIEKFLYEQIEKDPVAWRLHGCTEGVSPEQMALKGWINFFENPSIVSILPENPGLKCLAWEITYCPATSDSEWTSKAVNSNYGKGSGYGRSYIDENQRLEQREARLTEILRRTHSTVLDASDLYSASEKLVSLYKQNPDAMDLYFKLLGLVYR